MGSGTALTATPSIIFRQAARPCNGCDRRVGQQAPRDQFRLKRLLLLVHTIKRAHSSIRMLASDVQPGDDGVGRAMTELAHLNEHEHNKPFYGMCEQLLPGYHQVEFDTWLYLT